MTRPATVPVAAEQRLMLQRMGENSNPFAYNVMLSLEVRGDLDVPALQRALDALVARHHAFRTRFVQQDGGWQQVVLAPEPAALERVDLTAAEPAERDDLARDLTREFVRRPFDVSSGRLLRCLLLHRAVRSWDIVFSYHHLVMDAWSQQLLLDELAQLYSAEVGEADAGLPPVESQCTDHALWQRQTFTPEREADDLDYWVSELKGTSQILDLPSDRPRGSRFNGRGRVHEVPLSAELVQQVQEVSLRAGATFFLGMLTAVAVQLSTLTGRQDMVLSIPFFNREPEHERTITCTAGPVFLRCDLDPDESFHDAVARLGERFFTALEHRSLPPTTLLDALVAEGSWPSRRPPSAAVAMENDVSSGTVAMADLDVRVRAEAVDDVTHVDVLFSLRPTTDGLTVSLLYNTDLFDHSTVVRWGSAFLDTLHLLVTEPETPLRRLTGPAGTRTAAHHPEDDHE